MTASTTFDPAVLLGLRRHLSIIHHLAGRIRLRLGPGLWMGASEFDRTQLQRLLEALEGIRAVRVNRAAASVVIEYDPIHLPPGDWETLVRGDPVAAGELLDRWLARLDPFSRNRREEKP